MIGDVNNSGNKARIKGAGRDLEEKKSNGRSIEAEIRPSTHRRLSFCREARIKYVGLTDDRGRMHGRRRCTLSLSPLSISSLGRCYSALPSNATAAQQRGDKKKTGQGNPSFGEEERMGEGGKEDERGSQRIKKKNQPVMFWSGDMGRHDVFVTGGLALQMLFFQA